MSAINMIDTMAVTQVLGSIMKEPYLLDEYEILEEDFTTYFHRILFGAVTNLWANDIRGMDEIIIDEYLRDYPDRVYPTFQKENGIDYIINARELARPESFSYYYKKMRKFTILREANNNGVDTRGVIDFNNISSTDLEKQKAKLDKMSISELMEAIRKPIDNIEHKFVKDANVVEIKSSDGIDELLASFKEAPNYGRPFMGKIMTTITGGGRLGKFFLTSGSTGSGKTRLSMGETAYLSATEWYDSNSNEWITNRSVVPTLFITTEIPEDTVRVGQVGAIANVSQSKIEKNLMTEEEEKRVIRATEVLKNSEMYIVNMPDFNIKKIINIMNKYKRKFGVKHVYFDYMHTSMELMREFADISRGLSEEQMLRTFASQLKATCGNDAFFLHSGTQLGGNYHTMQKGTEVNEGLLRGAKAIADKIDFGKINLKPTKEELSLLPSLLTEGFHQVPNLISHVYKNREGELSLLKIWSVVDLGTCRTEELFLTNQRNEVINIELIEIVYINDEEFNIFNKETGECIF